MTNQANMNQLIATYKLAMAKKKEVTDALKKVDPNQNVIDQWKPIIDGFEKEKEEAFVRICNFIRNNGFDKDDDFDNERDLLLIVFSELQMDAMFYKIQYDSKHF